MIINDKIIKAEQNLTRQFAELEEIALYNQNKVINAFKEVMLILEFWLMILLQKEQMSLTE